MSITIGPARPEDFPKVLALLERSHLPADGLADHRDGLLVARDSDAVVGSAALEVYGDAALLRSVAVDEGVRGQGLGQRLTDAALELARGRGIHQVYLLTETAADFFPRFGFRPVARTEVAAEVQQSVEFTSVCPVSALVMLREITDYTEHTQSVAPTWVGSEVE
ncbi:MAG: arsenic resistance N-acetyltransferase ArsN2 [Anaerolineae bacterium]